MALQREQEPSLDTLDRAKLDSGDVITIGSTDMLFERRLVE